MSKRIDLLNERNTYIEDNLAIEIDIPNSLDNKPRMVSRIMTYAEMLQEKEYILQKGRDNYFNNIKKTR